MSVSVKYLIQWEQLFGARFTPCPMFCSFFFALDAQRSFASFATSSYVLNPLRSIFVRILDF